MIKPNALVIRSVEQKMNGSTITDKPARCHAAHVRCVQRLEIRIRSTLRVSVIHRLLIPHAQVQLQMTNRAAHLQGIGLFDIDTPYREMFEVQIVELLDRF